jgi:hypothetical protein
MRLTHLSVALPQLQRCRRTPLMPRAFAHSRQARFEQQGRLARWPHTGRAWQRKPSAIGAEVCERGRGKEGSPSVVQSQQEQHEKRRRWRHMQAAKKQLHPAKAPALQNCRYTLRKLAAKSFARVFPCAIEFATVVFHAHPHRLLR